MCNRKADNLLLFKSIVDSKSLSLAAKLNNISVSQASKRMTHLEHTLGVQLLQRSTRKMSLTPPGEELYKKLSSIKTQIDEAWDSMYEYTNEPKGEIRIACPIYYGLHNLIRFTKDFNQAYPQIQVDLKLVNNENDLEESRYDIQFKSHAMEPNQLIPDSNLCAKKVHSEKLVYVASNDYLEKHGTPNRPEEVSKHKCLAINNTNNGRRQWKFYVNQTSLKQEVDVAFETNNYEALYGAAKAGMGIAQIPASLYESNKENMTVLFEEHSIETLDTYAYYTKNKLASKKISLFLEKLFDNTQFLEKNDGFTTSEAHQAV